MFHCNETNFTLQKGEYIYKAMFAKRFIYLPQFNSHQTYTSGSADIYMTSDKKKVVGLERGPLSLVSTTEELLDRKVEAPV
jgi:hypothetical protein